MKADSLNSFHKGLMASLALHACVLAGLPGFSSDSHEPAAPESMMQKNHLEVIFARTHSQPSQQPAETEAGGSDSMAASKAYVNGNPIPEALPPQPLERLAILSREEVKFSSIKEGDEPGNLDEAKEGVSAVAVRNSIASFLQDYKSDLGREWLEECKRYKIQHGARDCPRGDPAGFSPNMEERAVAASLFAGIMRPAENSRQAYVLQTELDFLRSLNPDNAALEEAIDTRYFLQLQKYQYLTGAENDAYAAFKAATANVSSAARHEGSLAILGGGGASLLGAILALVGNDRLLAPGTGSDVIFTGYELEKPSNSEDENEEKVSEVLPPLFPPKH